MMLFLSVIYLLITQNQVSGNSLPEECFNPPLQRSLCGFYPDCLERAHACGVKGYALGYGTKYCERFSSNSTTDCMSVSGAKWRDSTLVCLQKALVNILPKADSMTCEEIENFAYMSHATCYTGGGAEIPSEPSVCFLSVSDIKCIYDIVDLRDLTSIEGLRAEKSAISICAKQVRAAGTL